MLIHPPENYFDLVEMNFSKQVAAGNDTPDLIHLFAANNTVFVEEMKKVLRLCKKNTSIVVLGILV